MREREKYNLFYISHFVSHSFSLYQTARMMRCERRERERETRERERDETERGGDERERDHLLYIFSLKQL